MQSARKRRLARFLQTAFPQLLPRNKSDTTGMAVSLMIALLVVLRAYNNRKVWRMKTMPRREELGDFSAGFNSLHLKIS